MTEWTSGGSAVTWVGHLKVLHASIRRPSASAQVVEEARGASRSCCSYVDLAHACGTDSAAFCVYLDGPVRKSRAHSAPVPLLAMRGGGGDRCAWRWRAARRRRHVARVVAAGAGFAQSEPHRCRGTFIHAHDAARSRAAPLAVSRPSGESHVTGSSLAITMEFREAWSPTSVVVLALTI